MLGCTSGVSVPPVGSRSGFLQCSEREQGGRVTCVSAGAVFFFVGDFQNNLGDLVLIESINWLSHGSNHLLIALLQLSNRILRLIC